MSAFTSIEQFHAQLKEGTTTCLGTVQYYLERIHATRHLNAFLEVWEQEALTQAKAIDQRMQSGQKTGRLAGVVIGIKDVLCYKGHKVSAASSILNNFTSLYTASAVQRLLDEDAILIGRLNCDEFAMGSSNENSAYGKVLNALDETRVPGGSSGGSAVAVQAGLCMLSLGSDTGGSVRQPADFCGVTGLKPGYGRISRYGLIAYASSFDQIGIFGINIPDLALALEIMAGPDEFDSTVSHAPVPAYSTSLEAGKKFRFAWFEAALNHPGLDPEIRTAILGTIEKLKAAGHVVEPVDFALMDYIVPAYYVLTTAEASSNLSRYDGVRFGYRTTTPVDDLTSFYKHTRSEGFGKEVKRRIMLGTFVLSAGYYDAYYSRAQKVRKKVSAGLELVFNQFDFILLPTSPFTAFKAGEKTDDPIAMYLADIYTVMANLAGIPAISLPLYKHSNGMPFSLQVMANRLNELPLLQISKELLAPGFRES
ncbi:MAG: Asp-tRNA(Asn)/Glu-tRNA(Gln) amidotransferase subunit GatA [Chitinophagaceae bacterium]|nr:Asp-tRNA(Asn)/Glu-tRNA(Gln) amidotransferase subunit GatA [Chitinophagaceae bacterium]